MKIKKPMTVKTPGAAKASGGATIADRFKIGVHCGLHFALPFGWHRLVYVPVFRVSESYNGRLKGDLSNERCHALVPCQGCRQACLG